MALTKQDQLRDTLKCIDGRGYKAYKDIRGSYNFLRYALCIDHIQGDPFASPSLLRVRVPQSIGKFPASSYSNRSRRVALEDYLTRAFGRLAGNRGDKTAAWGKAEIFSRHFAPKRY